MKVSCLCSEDLRGELIVVFGNGPGTNAPAVLLGVSTGDRRSEPPVFADLCRPGWALASWDELEVRSCRMHDRYCEQLYEQSGR
ncbi:hypothetical protein MCOR25_001777 [Pyricularia grisea]|nr:hypothetical protein MCOR25_001777 [Pyricularia grisea]